MTLFRPDDDRNLIPRWRDPAATAREGELAALRAGRREFAPQSVEDREADWRDQPTLHFATDLVGAALVVGATPAAIEAARQVVHSQDATPLARSVAARFLAEGDEGAVSAEVSDASEVVRRLKRRLANDPRNSLASTELARFYTIQGQAGPAERAMSIALKLAPNHRFVLRAASRLAVHSGDFQRAHAIVARSAATRRDPWLMATEIATSEIAQTKSKLIKAGLTFVERGAFSPRAMSELAGALGTLELRGGSQKKAKRLLTRALREPNENTVAHGEWASQRIRGLEVGTDQLETSWEARALRHAEDGDWREAVKAAWGWLEDQPFSSGPAEMGSYQASLGRDFEAGARIAEAGLRANPGEFLLSNNRAFCLINLGRLDDAENLLKPFETADLERDERATWLATQGLLQYRRGNPEVGRRLYLDSIERATDRPSTTIALIMSAAEELRSQSPQAARVMEQALAASEKSDRHPDMALWLEHLPRTT